MAKQVLSPLDFIAGSAAAPSISFGGDLTTGLYRSAANEIGIAVSGAIKASINANDLTLAVDLLVRDSFTAIKSGAYTLNLSSSVANGASAIGFSFNTVNEFSINGSRILKANTNATNIFYVGRDNSQNGAWANRIAIGDAASIDADSIAKLKGTMTVGSSTPSGAGFFDIDATINMAAAIRRASAFNGVATVTGSAVLPFVSGMLFQVKQSGTGSWGSNPSVWGDVPCVIAGRFTSTAGSMSLGNWGCTFFAGTPNFAGGVFSGTFNHFEASKTTSGQATNVNGLYIWDQVCTGNAYGIYIRSGSSGTADTAALVCHDDNNAGSILLGAGKDARIYYDGINLIINPKVVGSGVLDILGDLSLTAQNLITDTTTGTKIGTATTQKLGFWNATPVVKPSAYTQTYATATKTHANLTSATLTDSTTGTADTTVADVTAAHDQTILNNNFADLTAQINALRVDLENAKQVLNALIDDAQQIGLVG